MSKDQQLLLISYQVYVLNVLCIKPSFCNPAVPAAHRKHSQGHRCTHPDTATDGGTRTEAQICAPRQKHSLRYIHAHIRYLHHSFVCAVLNDLYGVQVCLAIAFSIVFRIALLRMCLRSSLGRSPVSRDVDHGCVDRRFWAGACAGGYCGLLYDRSRTEGWCGVTRGRSRWTPAPLKEVR